MKKTMNYIDYKTYTRTKSYSTFKERFEYLRLKGSVGDETFSGDRWLNQGFYSSKEWKQMRHQIIVRDNGCDLAIPNRVIYGPIIIHHINPIQISDILESSDSLLDPENLICCSSLTHKALHYSDYNLIATDYVEREPFDTCPWKK